MFMLLSLQIKLYINLLAMAVAYFLAYFLHSANPPGFLMSHQEPKKMTPIPSPCDHLHLW